MIAQSVPPGPSHSRSAFSRFMADLTLSAHFAFVLFAVAGAFLVLAWPVLVWAHLPVVIWSSVVNLCGWTCPLTPVENRFRSAAGGQAYSGNCLEHYVGRLVYPLGMPRRLELVAGVSILVWNALAYGGILLLRPGRFTGA